VRPGLALLSFGLFSCLNLSACMGICGSRDADRDAGEPADEEDGEYGEGYVTRPPKSSLGTINENATTGLTSDDSGPCELYMSAIRVKANLGGNDNPDETVSRHTEFRLALYAKGGGGGATQWWVADRASCTPNLKGSLHTPLRHLGNSSNVQAHVGPAMRLPRGLRFDQQLQVTIHYVNPNSANPRSLGACETTLERFFRSQDRALTLPINKGTARAMDKVTGGIGTVELHLTPVSQSRKRGARAAGRTKGAQLTFESLREQKHDQLESQTRVRKEAQEEDFRMGFEMQRARVPMGDRRTSKPNYRTSADTTAGGVVPRLSVENLGNQGNQRRQQRALSVPNVATMYHRTSTGGARVSDSGRSLMVGPASGSNGFMDESEVARARASAASRGRRKSYAGSGGVLSSMTMMDQPGVFARAA